MFCFMWRCPYFVIFILPLARQESQRGFRIQISFACCIGGTESPKLIPCSAPIEHMEHTHTYNQHIQSVRKRFYGLWW